jgi:hypothetical protein
MIKRTKITYRGAAAKILSSDSGVIYTPLQNIQKIE